MHSQAENIVHLIELALGHKINVDPKQNDLLILNSVTNNDELDLVRYYLNSTSLISDQLIAELVTKHLITAPAAADLLPSVDRWDQYLLKLEHLLEQVKLRKANDYEFNKRMPSQEQLLQLQQECWDLTTQWHGAGNLSCFYNYFVAMSQAAGVTSFDYVKMPKFVSDDNFISLLNKDKRRAAHLAHEQHYKEYLNEGGIRPHGRSVIDSTYINNVLYYKTAQLYFYHEFAKKVVVQALGLDDYGQWPYAKRTSLWHLLHEHFPDNTPADQRSIFYKFGEYINARPGEYFNYFSADLPEVGQVSPQQFHDIIKVAGLQSNYLCLISRHIVDNWPVKRHFSLRWQRKYPLLKIIAADSMQTIRPAGVFEDGRIVPNELPYGPGHGMSLCGTGLLETIAQAGTTAYEWNTPVDPKSEIDNWPRDIEKLFREFKFICPKMSAQNLLLGERLFNSFHNSLAYSTVNTTQHTHFIATSIERFPIYNLPASQAYNLEHLQTSLEIVPVGSLPDAMYLRFVFDDLDNEALLQFLLQFNQTIFIHFGGEKNFDVHIHLFATQRGNYVFIYEPHCFLIQLENDKFENPFTAAITTRKCQYLLPDGEDIQPFSNQLANGLEYSRKFYDDTAQAGVIDFINDFIPRFLRSQP